MRVKGNILSRILCWVLGHVQEGEIGPGEPVENHHCRRCGVAFYDSISFEKMLPPEVRAMLRRGK
jgi:hypothetical protein